MNDLSKRKYIYRIYSSEDCVIHCEKHPVIYINSKVVYYKDHRKQEYLNYRLVSSVYDEFIEVTLNVCGNFERYFWKVENFDSKAETEKAYSRRVQSDIELAKESMERAEKEYAAKKQKYYDLIRK
jgi:hypothetical protein